jgi:L,D-transpeptidase YcbB
MRIKNKKTAFSATFLAAALSLAVFACSYHFESRATSVVNEINLDIAKLIRQKAEQDEGIKSKVHEYRLSQMSSLHKQEPLLEKAYPTSSGKDLRFIADHKAGPDYEHLIDHLKTIFEDGIDPAIFHLDRFAEHLQDLEGINADLNQIQPLDLGVDTKTKIVQDLIVASKAKSAPKLNGAAVLEWLLLPEQAAKYPQVKETYEKMADDVFKRGKAENLLEIECAVAYFRYIREMGLREDMLLPNWEKSQSDFAGAMKETVPHTPHYTRLRSELVRYAKLAEKYPSLPALTIGQNVKIKKGGKNDLVVKIKERMADEGYYSGAIDNVFDDAAETALIEFQRTHQVVDDGAIGKGTADSMNVPYSARVKKIRLSMSKYRNSPSRWEEYYVRVNIPEFTVEVVEKGQVLRKHKVVVGNLLEINHTPQFKAFVTKVIYNPSWYITKRIFEKEEMPEYEKDPEYFKKKGYIVQYNKQGDPISAYEPPGYGNALGRVKIVFPNPYDVYMHDTPKKFLFARTIRPFSHGCIRLQNPLDMAEFLLKMDENPAVDKIDKILTTTATHEIELKKKIPIFVEYNTVSTTDEGRAVFLTDIYNEDKEALAKLDDPTA